ncbi:bacteriocin fulvocin C-related protein [Streptomyces sp. NPDC005790]|uniref:bacteriocin fulvocin C-related protein n=1 Tax=Streptomyces sp. NPDC005790 TaxID=3154777 RepID=UPI0033CE437B
MPAAHRPAVFAALSPSVRSSLWIEQVKRYRRAHSHMSPEQVGVLDEFGAIVADEATCTREDADIQARMKAIEETGIASFGHTPNARGP